MSAFPEDPPTRAPVDPRPLRPVAPEFVTRWVHAWFRRVEERTVRSRAERVPLSTDRPAVVFLTRSVFGAGGTIRTVLTAANYLASVGYSVEILCLLKPQDRSFFEIDPRVRIRTLLDERSRSPRLLARLVRTLLAPRVLPLRALDRWRSVLTNPEDVIIRRTSLLTDVLMVRALQRLPPCVLVATRPSLNVAAARFATGAARTLGQEHLSLPSRSSQLREWMLASYDQLDAVAVLTEADLRDFAELLRGPQVVRVPNGLPALPEEVSDGSSDVLSAVGRLDAQKGFDLLIPAFAAIAERFPTWTLRIYGDGGQRPVLERLIEQTGLQERVVLMGTTNRVASELARSSLFVLSSRYEGFGMVLLEAMGAGLPIVSFDCPRGPAELVDDEIGILVPPEDVPGLSDALAQLMADPGRRRALAAASRARAKEHLVDHETGRQWQAVLAQLAALPGPEPGPLPAGPSQ